MSEAKPFDPARPRHTLPFGGTDHDLVGTLEVIEAVEAVFREGISAVTARAVDMGVTEASKLVSALLTANGHKVTARQVGETIFGMGVNSDAFMLLKVNAYAFLRVALEPPELREKAAQKMGEWIGRYSAPPASPGESTRNSASAGSAGRRRSSGKPPPGT